MSPRASGRIGSSDHVAIRKPLLELVAHELGVAVLDPELIKEVQLIGSLDRELCHHGRYIEIHADDEIGAWDVFDIVDVHLAVEAVVDATGERLKAAFEFLPEGARVHFPLVTRDLGITDPATLACRELPRIPVFPFLELALALVVERLEVVPALR